LKLDLEDDEEEEIALREAERQKEAQVEKLSRAHLDKIRKKLKVYLVPRSQK
jgi:hypothetical protein